MKLRRIISVAAIIAVFASVSINASAHSSSQAGVLESTKINHANYNFDYYVGGPRVGWSINENYHIGNTVIRYKYAADVSDEVKASFTQAFQGWSDAGITFIFSNSAIGLISEYTNSNDSAYGKTTNLMTDSSGHFLHWEIKINSGKPIQSSTAAHELGHVIGLCDLYSASCNNKIMYYTRNGRTVTSPTFRDKAGAKVITGQHNSHSWLYRIKTYNQNGNVHERYCDVCKGIKYNSAAHCSYNSSGICTICGFPGSVSPDSFNHPLPVLMPEPERRRR